MTLFQFLTITTVSFVSICRTSSAYINTTIASNTLPWTNGRMYTTFDNVTQQIFIAGGQIKPYSFMTFNPTTETFTDKGNIFSAAISSTGQASTRIGRTWWMQKVSGTGFFTMNMDTESVTDPGVVIPVDTNHRACVASTNEALFIVGGYNGSVNLDTLQIYNIMNSEWLINNEPPRLQQRRGSLSCLIINNILYAIGGGPIFASNNKAIEFLDSVSDLQSIHTKQWQTFPSSFAVPSSTYLRGIRAVQYLDTFIIVQVKQYLNIIDTERQTIELFGFMPISLTSSTMVIANNVLYLFGGDLSSDMQFVDIYQTAILPVDWSNDPTQDPTQLPSDAPTENPTEIPSKMPTIEPTTESTQDPTENPVAEITMKPTMDPINSATKTSDNITVQTPTLSPLSDEGEVSESISTSSYFDDTKTTKTAKVSSDTDSVLIAIFIILCVLVFSAAFIIWKLYNKNREIRINHKDMVSKQHDLKQVVPNIPDIDNDLMSLENNVNQKIVELSANTVHLARGNDVAHNAMNIEDVVQFEGNNRGLMNDDNMANGEKSEDSQDSELLYEYVQNENGNLETLGSTNATGGNIVDINAQSAVDINSNRVSIYSEGNAEREKADDLVNLSESAKKDTVIKETSGVTKGIINTQAVLKGSIKVTQGDK